jgi:hypothetical protein
MHYLSQKNARISALLTLFRPEGHVFADTRAAANAGGVFGSKRGPVRVEKGVGRFLCEGI